MNWTTPLMLSWKADALPIFIARRCHFFFNLLVSKPACTYNLIKILWTSICHKLNQMLLTFTALTFLCTMSMFSFRRWCSTFLRRFFIAQLLLNNTFFQLENISDLLPSLTTLEALVTFIIPPAIPHLQPLKSNLLNEVKFFFSFRTYLKSVSA